MFLINHLLIKPKNRIINYNNLKSYLSNKNKVDLFIYGNGFGNNDTKNSNNIYLIKDNITSSSIIKKEQNVNKIESINLNEFIKNGNDDSNKRNYLLKIINELENKHKNNNNNNNNNSIIHIFTESDFLKNSFNTLPPKYDGNNIFYLKNNPNDRFPERGGKYCCSGCGKYKMIESNNLDNLKGLNQCNNCNLIIKNDINQLIVFSKYTENLISSIINKKQLSVFFNTTPIGTLLIFHWEFLKDLAKDFALFSIIFVTLFYSYYITQKN